ncbi:nucleoside deaminase [Actinomycetaceae bacterium WB03_NA08]|uniref:tRNA-specific adenosine deaminase n=2 Tax=Scrofimicrobium canadense TaxID=2652290 RepID=A0A6N7VR39_9ACTO|nr:nucleoside deaminase [Scrofimicrobium canadense]
MSHALLLAHRCTKTRDVPVGAVVLNAKGQIVGKGWNRRVAADDPTAHAELEALREAGRNLGTWNLTGCTLVVTLEPCTMCAGAAVNARVSRIIFGAWDAKAGACGSIRDVVRDARLNHQIEVHGGLMENEASVQLKAFFAERRRVHEYPESDFWAKRKPRTVSPASPTESISRQPTHDEKKPAASVPTPTLEKSDTKPTPVPAPPTRKRADRHTGRIVVPPLDDSALR